MFEVIVVVVYRTLISVHSGCVYIVLEVVQASV
jgi:hypothetical protein